LDRDWQYAESEQVMRDLVARHPDRVDLRQKTAQVFLEHGRQYAEWGQAAHAYQAFVEGERYDPENYLFPLNQARMQLGQRPHDEIRALLERATELAGDQGAAYVKTRKPGVTAQRIGGGRALLAGPAPDLKPDAPAYVALGLMIILRGTPPPAPLGLLGLLGRPPPKPTPPA